MSDKAKHDYGSYKRLIPPFVFYGSYHAHPMNQLIHMIFVPAILLTAFIFGSYLDLGAFLPSVLTSRVTPVIGTISLDLVAAIGYAAYYAYLSPNVVGISAAALVLLGFLAAQAFVSAVGSVAWVPALVLHLISWVLQVHLGHTVYEKRAPALLDNLAQVRKCCRIFKCVNGFLGFPWSRPMQAFIMAPFFVYVEVLMKLGLVPKLARTVNPLIAKEISRFINSKASAK